MSISYDYDLGLCLCLIKFFNVEVYLEKDKLVVLHQCKAGRLLQKPMLLSAHFFNF